MSTATCLHCQHPLTDAYCAHCGQPAKTKRISFSSLLHEVFHTFTHLDKGYGFTVRQLIRQPGTMQRLYLAGHRARHQKPFSYFFINATLCALVSYWVNQGVAHWYGAPATEEGYFFRHYFAILQVVLLPVYALVSWSVWKGLLRAAYNYGEMLVLILYSAGTFLLFICVIVLSKLFWPHLNTQFLEVPLLLAYNLTTNLRFFKGQPWYRVVLGTLFTFGINYGVSGYVGTLATHLLTRV